MANAQRAMMDLGMVGSPAKDTSLTPRPGLPFDRHGMGRDYLGVTRFAKGRKMLPGLALRDRALYDDRHMSVATSSRTAPSRKEATHERIVGAAARAIRRSGYGGTGVADIMK